MTLGEQRGLRSQLTPSLKSVATPEEDHMASATWDEGWQRLLRRVDTTAERVTDGFPHYGDPATGRRTTPPGGDWTERRPRAGPGMRGSCSPKGQHRLARSDVR
jgi:hypothetical protein